MRKLYGLTIVLVIGLWLETTAQNGIVVFQSDFGQKDGAVSAMKGVALGVSSNLRLFDLTHEIPPYNIWEAAYRLHQTAPYYPAGTVFVSVCDPGVGTDRKSVVLLTKSGHYFVTPDNGTLTLVAEQLGIGALRQIDEKINRLVHSNESYTFHGRDVYAYTAARLAARSITFEQVGPELPNEIMRFPYQKAEFSAGIVKGTIPVLDPQYGNVWSNISRSLFQQLAPGPMIRVRIFNKNKQVFDRQVRIVHTFGEVEPGVDVVYLNSLLNVSLAINQGDFAKMYAVGSGADWQIWLSK